MNFIDQWQVDRKLEKVTRQLNFSNGFKDERSTLAALPDTDQRLVSYLEAIKHLDDNLTEVADQPEAVLLGDQRFFPQTVLIETHRSEDRQRPPRRIYSATLNKIFTSDVETTIRHLTQLTAAHRNVPPEDQPALTKKALNSWNENHGPVAEVQIDDDWRLWIHVNLGNDRHFVAPYLVPIEKDIYSADWTTRQTGKLERKIQPKYLSKVVSQAAARNFRLRDIPVANFDPFDLGGKQRMDEIIQKAGYREAENDDARDYRSTARTAALRVFSHQDSESDKKAPLLGVEKSIWDNNIFNLLAIAPHALSKDIKAGFQKKFQAGAGKIVKDKIKEGLKSGGEINLSPDKITTETLNKLEHRIVADDYHDQLDWLYSIALGETLKELASYPKTKDAAVLLNQVRKLSAAAQKIDDVLAEDAGAIDPEFTLGWKPDEVSMVFPAAWFAKK